MKRRKSISASAVEMREACPNNAKALAACAKLEKKAAALEEELARLEESLIVQGQKHSATDRLRERWVRAGINIAHYTNPSASASLPADGTSTAPHATQDVSSIVPQSLPFPSAPPSSFRGAHPVSSQPIEQPFALPTLHHTGAPTMKKKRKTMSTESHIPAYLYAEASLPRDIPLLQHHVPRGYAHSTSIAPMHPEPQYNLPQCIPPQYNLSQYYLPPLQSDRK